MLELQTRQENTTLKRIKVNCQAVWHFFDGINIYIYSMSPILSVTNIKKTFRPRCLYCSNTLWKENLKISIGG